MARKFCVLIEMILINKSGGGKTTTTTIRQWRPGARDQGQLDQEGRPHQSPSDIAAEGNEPFHEFNLLSRSSSIK